MDPSQAARRSGVLYARVTRSLAHTVGNAVNVVAGRLSLIEEAVPESSRPSLHRARARLQGLLDDLKGALRFLPPVHEDSEEPVGLVLRRLQGEGSVQLVCDDPGLLDWGPAGPQCGELALRYLLDAHRTLAAEGDGDVWRFGWHLEGSERSPALAIELDANYVAEERKALLEPWFAGDTQLLDGSTRYGRLLLAQGLGLLEDSGVTVVLGPGEAGCTRLALVWRGFGEKYGHAP